MDNFFKKIDYRFRIDDMDITDDLEKVLQSEKNEGTLKTTEKDKILKFSKSIDKIEIKLENNKFLIDKEPIKFMDDNKNILFKIYDHQSPYLLSLLQQTNIYYDFYLPTDKKISLDDLIKKIKENKTIIIKLKFNQYIEIFEPLCTKLAKSGDIIDTKVNYFLPESSQSLLVDHNSDFKLFIAQRIDLVNKIIDFIKSTKYILKIYGTDGIGKSISFLYLTTIEINYKFIYFNLKDIYKYKSNKYLYFKNAMMKYYSNYPNIISDKDRKNKDNYFLYTRVIKDLEKIYGEKFLNGDFWNMLEYFCEYILEKGNSVIIIDQYKSEYGKFEIVNKILSTYKKIGTIKFIISSSLNDYSVKEDFIIDLMIIYKDKIVSKTSLEKIENIKESKEEELENQLFKNFKLEEISGDKECVDNDFSLIFDFNDKETIEPEESHDEIKTEEFNELNDEDKKRDEIFCKNRIRPNDIIYINNLISVKTIINKDDDNLLRLFNYNPKTYTKYNLAFTLNEQKTYLHDSFLRKSFNEINYKIKTFYDNLSYKKYKEYSSENLKGTFLLKLNEIIKNNKELDLEELIKSLEVYPFKYLKIYITDSDPKDNNIIVLNDNLINKKFKIDYSYEFIEIAFSKIIDMIANIRLIDMNDLTGSGFGSFLENKIRKKIEKEKFEIRYFWNFTSISNKNYRSKDKYIYDYNNFKKIKIEFDDVKKYKINDYNKYYYIIPGSETNRSLDSVILQPYDKNSLDMICIQMTKFKKEIKKKNEYINDCFIAKAKFESNYKIKVNNVYFYFILAEDFPNDIIKKNLESKGIAYFYYSTKDNIFRKKNTIIKIKDLNKEEAKIEQNLEDNEYLYFKSKLTLINIMENFLQKKRRIKDNFKITHNYFDAARKYLFKFTPKINLDEENKIMMKNIVKNNNNKYSNISIIFQFVFMIQTNEYYHLRKKDNLIGIMINYNQNKDQKLYHYFYKGNIYPNNYNNMPGLELFICSNKEKRIIKPKQNEYLISEVPDDYFNKYILMFKIYSLIKINK